jgi:antitoxin CptB
MNVIDDFLQGLDPASPLGEREFSKLRWRCRRGLLENDLMIQTFFQQHGQNLTVSLAQALYDLMDLSDNDLLDLLLKRCDLEASFFTPERHLVLNMLRRPDVSSPGLGRPQ